jgi:hypothetical protein
MLKKESSRALESCIRIEEFEITFAKYEDKIMCEELIWNLKKMLEIEQPYFS